MTTRLLIVTERERTNRERNSVLTFDDIVFRTHPDGQGLLGKLTLPDGEVFSVTRGREHGFVTVDEPYEVYVYGEIYERMTSSKIDALLCKLQQG